MHFFRFVTVSLALLFCGTHSSLAVERSHCESLFVRQRSPVIVLSGEIRQSDPSQTHLFVRKDVTNDFFFSARLSEKKVLTFSTVLKLFELPVRSGLYGPRLFREMMEHFGPQNVEVIVGRWVDGTNLDNYNSAIKSGLKTTEAAQQTWTGRQAALYGFNKVRSVIEEKHPITGRQISIVVEFVRE